MALNAVVDTPSDSGVPVYRDSFLRTDYLARNPSQEPLLLKLRNAIDELVSVPCAQCSFYIELGRLDSYNRSMPQVTRDTLCT